MPAGLDADPDVTSAEEAALITELDPTELAELSELAQDDSTYSRVKCEDLARELGTRKSHEPLRTGSERGGTGSAADPDSAAVAEPELVEHRRTAF